MEQDKDARAVEALIGRFAEGWNAADAVVLASVFAEDADFTAVNGLCIHGRDLIRDGHDELFRTIFRGVRLAARPLSVRFLSPGIAVVEAEFSYPGGMILPGVIRALAQYVAVRSGAAWEIAVFRNMVPFERPVAGPVELNARARMQRSELEVVS
jgi:uncharacterized protein (TIGR02246 family)